MGAFAVLATSCAHNTEQDLQAKVDEYATVEVKSPLIESLSDKDKQVLNLLREAGKIMDDLFWMQTFGDRTEMEVIDKQAMKDFAMINYGPWDRLEDNTPFVPGYGAKPLGANYYPADMTAEEWEAFDDPDKDSPYTVIRRDENGKLKCVWYRDEYREKLAQACRYMYMVYITLYPCSRQFRSQHSSRPPRYIQAPHFRACRTLCRRPDRMNAAEAY